MNYIFRTATEKDQANIKKLFIEMLQTIYHTETVQGYAEGDLESFFHSPDHKIYIAEYEGLVIAYLSIEHHHEPSEYLYLDDLCVTKRHRNSGIGTHLIQTAEEYAKHTGIPAVVLHVEKCNLLAYKLYERLGYRIYRDEQHRYSMVKYIK